MALHRQFEHPRVLVVEDEFIIGLDLAETVRAMGCRVDGPHIAKRTAFAAIRQNMPDFAILDVLVEDGEIYPLAEALREAGVPMVFHSGHATPDEIRAHFPDAEAAEKPCPPADLVNMIRKALNTTTH